MPNYPFSVGLDMQGNYIYNSGFEVVNSAPSSNNFFGRIVANSNINKIGFYDGSQYIWLGALTSSDVTTALGFTPVANTVTVNGYALSSNISLTASDVGALPDSTTIPTVNNSTITIQKNGSTVESFTLNQASAETINITVPTTASDVGALPSNTTINDLTSTAQQSALNSGITSSLVTQIGTNQTDISTINGKIPSAASTSNQLADKQYVDNAISTNTADFDGSWATYAAIPSTVAGFTNEGLPEPSNNNYLVVLADETQDGGTWRYKYVDDGSAYNKNKWQVEYEINESPFTQTQLDAINSGANTTNIGQIATNTTNIGSLQTAIATKAEIFAVTNPSLTVSGGVCSWSITNSIGTKNVQVTYYREADGVEIKAYTKVTTSTITASFNSASNISAGTYRAVIAGLK